MTEIASAPGVLAELIAPHAPDAFFADIYEREACTRRAMTPSASPT
jgi:hypothetical protein